VRLDTPSSQDARSPNTAAIPDARAPARAAYYIFLALGAGELASHVFLALGASELRRDLSSI